MLRERIKVKLDYREQLSISDKIINLIFGYVFYPLPTITTILHYFQAGRAAGKAD